MARRKPTGRRGGKVIWRSADDTVIVTDDGGYITAWGRGHGLIARRRYQDDDPGSYREAYRDVIGSARAAVGNRRDLGMENPLKGKTKNLLIIGGLAAAAGVVAYLVTRPKTSAATQPTPQPAPQPKAPNLPAPPRGETRPQDNISPNPGPAQATKRPPQGGACPEGYYLSVDGWCYENGSANRT
jgi:hypothetical protein